MSDIYRTINPEDLCSHLLRFGILKSDIDGVIFRTSSGDLAISSPYCLHSRKIFSHLWSFSSSDYLLLSFVRRAFQNSSRCFPGTLALRSLVCFQLKGKSYFVEIFRISKGIHMSRQNNNWVTGLGRQIENSDYGLSLPSLCTLSASVCVLQTSLCTFRTHFLTPNTFHNNHNYKSDSLLSHSTVYV